MAEWKHNRVYKFLETVIVSNAVTGLILNNIAHVPEHTVISPSSLDISLTIAVSSDMGLV